MSFIVEYKNRRRPKPQPVIKTLYARLKEAGCELDSWQSDLYALDTIGARKIIMQYEAEGGISNKTVFTGKHDGRQWIELPFHYQPYWDQKGGKA